ncbi:MAG TPA: NAD-dependent succinate-semialdehyde dehydrogenase [Woeseiaceae bacterium]|nr:NAD-dependent succinate-semialdehyde dehydrogenase [Woeseiaceae bacterium]
MQQGLSENPATVPDLLRDPTLFREAAFTGGRWLLPAGAEHIEVRNPSSGRLLGRIPVLGDSDVDNAISAAREAFSSWRSSMAESRAELLLAWYRLIIQHKEDLAKLITLEQGKPLAESIGEIEYGAGFVRWFAEEARRAYGETIPTHLPGRNLSTVYEPCGVAVLITPWNFPHAMLVRKAAAAIAAGCSVIALQSEETPFSALALAELADRAGFPAGLINVLTGHAKPIVARLCDEPTVRVVSFTGSTAVGRIILQQASETVKRVCMELGGHAPFIGFPDVDMDTLVDAAIAAKFQTSGQDCLAANRIYIHHHIYDEFVKEFTRRTEALKVGDGFDDSVEIGPLQHEGQVRKAIDHVQDAVAKGARLMTGGTRHGAGELFYTPTVLADVTPEMKIYTEETFGPVAALCSFTTEQEVLSAANQSEYGLAAYVYSRDVETCLRMSSNLEYGMVGVNSIKLTGPPIPFGGVKQSGMGREGARYGLREFSNLKYICMNNGSTSGS